MAQLFRYCSLLLIVVTFFVVFTQPSFAVSKRLEEGILRELRSTGYETYDVGEIGEEEVPLIYSVSDAVRIFIGVLGAAAVILFAYAGFLWMTAGGNDEQIKKARKMMRQVIIGIIIIFIAYAIVTFVISALPAPEE